MLKIKKRLLENNLDKKLKDCLVKGRLLILTTLTELILLVHQLMLMFTSVNVAGSSYENLGGLIPVNAATFPNDDFPTDPLMPDLEDTVDLQVTGIFSGAYDDEDVGAEADLNNLETTMSVFAPVTRIEAVRLFLVYASFMGFIVYKMDVKSAFLYGTIEEEVYVCQPPGFEDLQFPDKVYKVYVDDIIFGSTKKSLCIEFEGLMHKKFQISSIGKLTFFLGLQVMQRDDGIFIKQDKYVADILKKFDFSLAKIASTLIDTNKALLKDEEVEDVDVHLYRSMTGLLMYLIASRPDIIFVVYACARDSPFDLEAFYDSDYAGASIDRKSTTGDLTFWLLALDYLISEDVFVRVMIDEFVDQHNMVACLERTDENAEFHQIVDFLTTSSIHYALTQIHATVDGKTVVISESSVRSDLHFNDGDGITCLTNTAIFENLALMGISLTEPFNDTYEAPKHTKKSFTNMKRKGKDFSGRVTLLFASKLAPPVFGGEGSGQPSEPQPPSSTTQPIIEEQIPITELSSPQNTQSPRQALQKDTQLPQTNMPIPNVVDEAAFKERDDKVVRATTTAAILDAAQASGNITKTQSTAMSNDPLSQEIGSDDRPRSDEERNEQQDLTGFVPPTPHDSPLSGGYTSRSDEGMKLFKIGTSRRKGLDKENVSKQGRKSNKTKPMFKDSDFDVLDDAMENFEGGSTTEQITTARDTLNTASINGSAAGPSTSTTEDNFEDEMTTIADTLVAIRSARPRTTSIVIRNVEEEPKRETSVPTVQSQDKGKGKIVEPEPTPKNLRKAQIRWMKS
ncbi:retrovirus-related pol polyprotein from transposon TNT 1-94 [Tanacetum coccineum]